MQTPASIADVPVFTWVFLTLGVVCLGFVVRYSRRAYRDRHPEKYRRSVGRYGGRYGTAAVGAAGSLLFVLAGIHLGTWREYGPTVNLGEVKARRDGDGYQLTLLLRGHEPRQLRVRGRYWVLRNEVLAFNPKLGALGLRNYYRPVAIDGLSDRGQRVMGTYESREVVGPSSPLYRAIRKLPEMPWFVSAREESTPLKEGGDAELFLVAGGTAG